MTDEQVFTLGKCPFAGLSEKRHTLVFANPRRDAALPVAEAAVAQIDFAE